MSNLARRTPYLRYLLNHIHEQWTKPCKHWNKKKLLSLYIHNSALVFFIMWYIWNKGFWSIWAFIRNLYFSLGHLRFLVMWPCAILRLLIRYFFLKYKEGRFFLEPSVYICWLRRASCFRHFCFCLYIFVLMCR